jgi:hypothetical protein
LRKNSRKAAIAVANEIHLWLEGNEQSSTIDKAVDHL